MAGKKSKRAQPSGTAGQVLTDSWEDCYRKAEHCYAEGDYRDAFSWYKKASALPDCNPVVFFELGYLFQHGEGVAADSVEAVSWYEKAASLDVPQAMYNLAYFYQNGLVVDQDIQKAGRLLRDATSLMDRLQLERGSYDAWKADYNERFSALERTAQKNQLRSESLELLNQELNADLSKAKQECLRLEKEAGQNRQALDEAESQFETLSARAKSAEDALEEEQNLRKNEAYEASVRQTQAEERLRASDELIGNLIREHNESFEQIQSSCSSQVERIQKAYESELTTLRDANERLSEQNTSLSQTLGGKTSELDHLKESIQQIQLKLNQEQKKARLAFILTGVFGLLTVILLITM